jgi:tetratricopeptide (TPR) repeat protein
LRPCAGKAIGTRKPGPPAARFSTFAASFAQPGRSDAAIAALLQGAGGGGAASVADSFARTFEVGRGLLSPAARDLLGLIAECAPDDIPLTLLADAALALARGDDGDSAASAPQSQPPDPTSLAAMALAAAGPSPRGGGRGTFDYSRSDASWLEFGTDGSSAGPLEELVALSFVTPQSADACVSMHRLVQAEARLVGSGSRAAESVRGLLRRALAVSLCAFLAPQTTPPPPPAGAGAAAAAGVGMPLSKVGQNQQQQQQLTGGALQPDVARRYLHHARSLAERISAAKKRPGDDDDSLLPVQRRTTDLPAAADGKEAEKESPDELAAWECALIETAAWGLLVSGQFKAGAASLQRQVVSRHRRVLGEFGLETLASTRKLGLLLQAEGDLAGAARELGAALSGRYSVLGMYHPETLTSRYDVGCILYTQGKLSQAAIHLETVVSERSTLLGVDDEGTLEARATLASVELARASTAQEKAAAGELLLDVLKTSRRVFPQRHIRVLVAFANYGAFLLRTSASPDEAEPYLEEALESSAQALGPSHPHTLVCVSNLGCLRLAQKRLGEAETLLIDALEARKRLLGPSHPHTLVSISNLGRLRKAQGRWREAEALFEEDLERSSDALGEEHIDTIVSITRLADLISDEQHKRDGRTRTQALHRAAQLYGQALEKSITSVGAAHPCSRAAAKGLRRVYKAPGMTHEPNLVRLLSAVSDDGDDDDSRDSKRGARRRPARRQDSFDKEMEFTGGCGPRGSMCSIM